MITTSGTSAGLPACLFGRSTVTMAGNVFAPGTPPLDFTVFGRAGVVGGGAVGMAGRGVGSVDMGRVVRIGVAMDG